MYLKKKIFLNSLDANHFLTEEITKNLLDTFRGNPNEDWWSKIITERK